MPSQKNSGMVVLTTVAKKTDAKKIATLVVRAGLAACVNIIPAVESHYIWKGKVHVDREWLLLVKTTTRAYPALATKLGRIHPYECPEIVGLEMARIAPGYRDWLLKSVKE